MPVIRCRNIRKLHNKDFTPNEDKGAILVVLQGNSIFSKCGGSKNTCGHWTKIDVAYPGIDDFDFKKAALSQSIMPRKFTFPLQGKDIEPAPILIED